MNNAKDNSSENDENWKKKLNARCDLLRETFSSFMDQLHPRYNERVYLNNAFLELAVTAYFDDIERYKMFSGAERADNHKQSAYTIKWIAKIKPIQLLPVSDENKDNYSTGLIDINLHFAIYSGIILFLRKGIFQLMSEQFLNHLIYSLRYRNISGKQWALSMFLLEKIAEACDWDHTSSEKFKIETSREREKKSPKGI
jgi:hypothetical protein